MHSRYLASMTDSEFFLFYSECQRHMYQLAVLLGLDQVPDMPAYLTAECTRRRQRNQAMAAYGSET